MKGRPSRFVQCTNCPSVRGFVRTGLCRSCTTAKSSRRLYHWKPEDDDCLRAIYRTQTGRRSLTVQMDRLALELDFRGVAVRRRASELGLTRDTGRPWKPEEVQRLRELKGTVGIKKIAKLLHRSQNSVGCKLESLGLGIAREGVYSGNDLERLFGVSGHQLRKWRDGGFLRIDDEGVYERSEVVRFILEHPEAYDVRCAERNWYREMLRSAGVMLAELRAAVFGERIAA